jgi:hypothetical protein
MGFKSRKNKSKSKSNKINKKRCKVTRKKRCKVTRKVRKGGMFPTKKVKVSHLLEPQIGHLMPEPKIYENKQNPFIPLTESELYVLGGDYLYSRKWKQILEKYPEGSEIGDKIRKDIELRKGLVRCEAGQIVFNELPDAKHLRADFPYGHLLKLVIAKKQGDYDGLSSFIPIYSQANLTNLDYAEDYMEKYFDDELNFHDTEKKVVYITPDIIDAINLEQRHQGYPNFNLLWERSMNGQNYNEIVTEYLIRMRGFNPERDIYLLPKTEVGHPCLANNFKKVPLEMSTEEGIQRPNIYGGFEFVIYKKIDENEEENGEENGEEKIDVIVNDQSGHFQTEQEALLKLLKPLLEAKGYGKFTILFPPRDKRHYRTYMTTDPRNIDQRRFTRAMTKEEQWHHPESYVEVRGDMQKAKTDPSIIPQSQIRRAISVKESPTQSQSQEVVMEE